MRFNQPFNETDLRKRLKAAKNGLSMVVASNPTIECVKKVT
jgi:hypothetical protein